jgi:hypothetical protein
MNERTDRADDGVGDRLAVDVRVRVNRGTGDRRPGVVVDDFGDLAGHGVVIGGHHIADPGRRWAVLLDDGSLVFTDTEQLEPE